MKILSLLKSGRMLAILVLGFSSGLPLAMIGTGGTFQAWLTDDGLSVKTLGFLSLVMMPFALKFLWAPFLDRYLAPVLHSRGRRQGWMLITQFALAAIFVFMSFLTPRMDLYWIVIACFLAAFASASQDIVIDAYRAEVLEQDELGPGASLGILGYRIGMIMSGAVALSMGQFMSWSLVYQAMAATMLIGAVAAWFAPQPKREIHRPANLKEAIYKPFAEFLSRRGAVELLLFVVLYKIGDVMAAMFTTRFMLDLGFEKVDIAAVVKGLGLAATIVGSLLGGLALAQVGMKRALIGLGLIQAGTILSFAVLAHFGKNYTLMATAIGLENLGSGLGTAAFAAFLMSLCDKRFTGTQYALLTSLAGLTRSLIGAPCGFLAESLGWEGYFIVSTLVSVPALVLVALCFHRWEGPKE